MLIANDLPVGVALVLVAKVLVPAGVVVLIGGADHVFLAAGDFMANGAGDWSAAAAGDCKAAAAGDINPELNDVVRPLRAGLRRLLLLALAAPNMEPLVPAAGERQLLALPSAVDAPVGVADVDDVPLLKNPVPERKPLFALSPLGMFSPVGIPLLTLEVVVVVPAPAEVRIVMLLKLRLLPAVKLAPRRAGADAVASMPSDAKKSGWPASPGFCRSRVVALAGRARVSPAGDADVAFAGGGRIVGASDMPRDGVVYGWCPLPSIRPVGQPAVFPSLSLSSSSALASRVGSSIGLIQGRAAATPRLETPSFLRISSCFGSVSLFVRGFSPHTRHVSGSRRRFNTGMIPVLAVRI